MSQLRAANKKARPRGAKGLPESTVAKLATANFITIFVDDTVGDTISKIRQRSQRGNIFYLYVVDPDDKLCGIVSIRNLLLAQDSEPIRAIYATGIVSLSETAPLSEAYRVFSESRFLSLPVVNPQGRITGVIQAHELVEEYDTETEALFEERNRGELFELLGIKAEDASKGIVRVAMGRLPWLLLNLLGGIVSAIFIRTLGAKLIDAVEFLALLPILQIVSESIGMQTASVVIGTLRHGSVTSNVQSVARRETGVALLLGFCCALIVGGLVLLWKNVLGISVAVALSIFIATLYVSVLGTTLPYFIHRLKGDPRIAAGPVVLALADCGTLLIYLLIAVKMTTPHP